MKSITFFIYGAMALLVLWSIFTYNSFITLINRAKEAWADINVQLKRRYDLIPNLVETVKRYATHEAGTFQKVTEARTAAMKAENVEDRQKAENILTGALKSIFALSENYPDLKANQNFLELQRELADTENKIQSARRFYNNNVRDLSIGVDSFPGNIVARIFKFKKMDFFEIEEGSEIKEPVKVKF